MTESSARLEREKQLSSIEAEIRLRDAQKQIREHAFYEGIKDRILKEFWPKNFSPAPFIEDLRLREFAHMPIDNLLRKRSFTANKLNAILLAVDNACAPEKSGGSPLISPKLLEEYLRSLGFELKPISDKKVVQKKKAASGKSSKKKRLSTTTLKSKTKKKADKKTGSKSSKKKKAPAQITTRKKTVMKKVKQAAKKTLKKSK